MEEVNFEYSESVGGASITGKSASVEELVSMAKEIWSEVIKTNPEHCDRLLGEMQKRYSDFNISFPLVLRWMVQMRSFSPKAFETFLRKYKDADLSSREKFLELQAEYIVILYKQLHPHYDERAVKEYRKNLVKQLLDEDKEFIKVQKEVEEEMSKLEESNDAERRRRLYEFIMAQRLAASMQ